MILSSLHVKNIRSHADTRLKLGPGSTLLAGDVGAGKTSLLYAIEMALFGFAEVDPAHLVRHRAREAEVTLALTDGTHTYEFRRRFRRRTIRGRESYEVEECSFAQDGARTKYSATELRSRSIDLLGFPDNPNPRAHSDVWRWAVYIPQERMRDVLLQEPTERLATVRKALGLEQYHQAAENAAEVAAELRRVAEAREGEAELLKPLADELPRWMALRTTWDRERVALEDEVFRRRAEGEAAEAALLEVERLRASRSAEERSLADRRAELARMRREAEVRRAELDERRSERERVAKESREVARDLERLRARVPRVAEERERFRTVETRLTATEEAVRRRAQAEVARDGETRALAELEEAQQGHERDRVEVARRLAAAEAERPTKAPTAPTERALSEIDSAIVAARASVEARVTAVTTLSGDRTDLERLVEAGTCPRCHQTVSRDHFASQLEESRRRLAEAEAGLAGARETLAGLEAERGSRERYERARDRFLELEERRSQLREQVRRFDALNARLVDQRAEHRSALAHAIAEIGSTEGPLTERAILLREREELRRAIEEAERLAGELGRLEQRSRDRAEREAALQAEIARGEATGREEVAELEQRARAVAEAESELRSRPDLERALEDRRSGAEAARAELERVLQRSSRIAADLQNAEDRIREAEAGRRQREEKVAEGLHLRTLAGWLGREFREGLFDLEHRRLARAQAEFNRLFARYFQTLLEDPNLVARCDTAFTPMVEIDGEPTPAEALSGGERTALALAFRLAMGHIVRTAGRLKLETIILDEPTDGFSPGQVSRMGELLEEIGIPQVILVSHETQLSGVADRVIQVTKDQGPSEVHEIDPPTAIVEAAANPSAPPEGRRVPG